MAKEVDERLRKLEELKKLGINPYAYLFRRTVQVNEIIANFKKFSGKRVAIAGRIRAMRGHGKIKFMDLEDSTGRIQILARANVMKDYNLLNLYDLGDIIGVTGTVTKSKSGEMTIEVKKIEILTKSLKPLPSSYHGFKDADERYRKRYLDLIMNPEVREKFVIRRKIFQAMREWLDSRGWLEVETPIMQSIYGGGLAKPFVTHHNALKKDMYLRISNEMYLKRLLVGGYDKIYEFSIDFRNEGIDTTHNPEFCLWEGQEAYGDYNDGMRMIEQIIEYVAKKVFGTTEIEYQGTKINLKAPWKKMTMLESLKKLGGIDADKMSVKDLLKEAKKHKIEIIPGAKWGEIVAALFEELVEPKLIQPTHIHDYPWEVSPLSKKSRKDLRFTERFETFIVGKEYTNNYSELTDSQELRKNFIEQLGRSEAGDEEAHPMDEDYIEALEYGMPPSNGMGIGIDRIVMLLTDSPSIRDVVFFPQLRDKGVKAPEQQIFGDEVKGKIIKNKGEYENAYDPLRIEKAVLEKFEGVKVGYAVIKGVEVKKDDKALEKLKKEELKKLNPHKLLRDSKILKEYERIYKETGIDITKKKPSPTALLKRLAEGKSLYKVNTIVDAYNIAVIKTQISMGAFDLSRLNLPMDLRFADEGEAFQAIGEDKIKKLKQGELIFADQDIIVTRDLDYRDADKTKIRLKTKDLFVVADGTKATSEKELKKALSLAIALITKYSGGKVEKIAYTF